MKIRQAKRFIADNEIIERHVFDYISSNIARIYSKACSSIDYEFSLGCKHSEVGLQYEPLYHFKYFSRQSLSLKREICLFIRNFLTYSNKIHMTKFNLKEYDNVIHSSFNFNNLIMHFGFEINRQIVTRLKIYFIPLCNLIPDIRYKIFVKDLSNQLKIINSILQYKWPLLKPLTDDTLDAIAIDFYSDGKHCLKIYQDRPFKGKADSGFNQSIINRFNGCDRFSDTGIMYRISGKNANKVSLAKVYFYPKPPFSISYAIRRNKLKISKQVKEICKNRTLDLKRSEIYSISVELNNLLTIYVR